MDPTAHISPASLAMDTNSMSPDPILKMEDFNLTPSHSLSVTKPVKKRKSWGQELPEPKTTLPPRKRAKTDDEKEQRRIERIKRNRAAAHNSRERKRVEAEHLAVQNDALLKHISNLRQRIALQDAQLAKCRDLIPGGLPEVSAQDSSVYNTELNDSLSSTSPSSSYTIDPRASLAEITPATSPADTTTIKLEEDISIMPPPLTSEVQATGALDLTQHSAAMLCDLPCRSSKPTSSLPSLLSTLRAWWWTQLILLLTNLNLMTFYKTTLLAFWTNSPARMTSYLSNLSKACSTLTLRPRPLTSPHAPTLLRTSWSTLAQLLLATGQLPLGSSAQALKQTRADGLSLVQRHGAEALSWAIDGNDLDDDHKDHNHDDEVHRLGSIGSVSGYSDGRQEGIGRRGNDHVLPPRE